MAGEGENMNKFCCRCQEDFPVKEGRHFQRRMLTELKYAPAKIKRSFNDWLDSEIHGKGYLCGSCYFNLTD